jgi:hypothetical protein
MIEHDTILSIGIKKSDTITLMQIEKNFKVVLYSPKKLRRFFLVPQS